MVDVLLFIFIHWTKFTSGANVHIILLQYSKRLIYNIIIFFIGIINQNNIRVLIRRDSIFNLKIYYLAKQTQLYNIISYPGMRWLESIFCGQYHKIYNKCIDEHNRTMIIIILRFRRRRIVVMKVIILVAGDFHLCTHSPDHIMLYNIQDRRKTFITFQNV